MMRMIAIPFLGWAAPADASSMTEKLQALQRALRRALLAVLDRLVPPRAPTREPEPPPEWFKYPPF
jgi:hypothetical protein